MHKTVVIGSVIIDYGPPR